jgi:hypothetical protein
MLLIGAGVATYFLATGALAPRPSLRILAPESGAAVSAGLVNVRVEVRNALLTDASSRGYHLHYYLDAILPTTPGRAAIPTDGAWASTLRTSYDWSISGAGLHILAVQLVTHDDRPLRPPVAAAITLEVKQASPRGPADAPSGPTKVPGGS